MGFQPEAFFPAYGLAENSLAVSFSKLGTPPVIKHFDTRRLEREGRVVELPASEGGRALVGVGDPLETVGVEILDDAGTPVGPNILGEVAIKGPSTTAGYYNNRFATAGVRNNGWLLTGDFGFMDGNQLYISGRRKDMIIRAGRNFFAEDLEAAASTVPDIRPGGVWVFGIKNRRQGTEEVVLLVEGLPKADPHQLVEAIKREMRATVGMQPNIVGGCSPHAHCRKHPPGNCNASRPASATSTTPSYRQIKTGR